MSLYLCAQLRYTNLNLPIDAIEGSDPDGCPRTDSAYLTTELRKEQSRELVEEFMLPDCITEYNSVFM